MRDFWVKYYIFMGDFLVKCYIFMRDFCFTCSSSRKWTRKMCKFTL